MEWFEALILGLIQGLTEYLPVSSSGHLAIGSALFGIEGEENLAFTIVVHVATVFSTLVILWKVIPGGRRLSKQASQRCSRCLSCPALPEFSEKRSPGRRG